MAGAKPKMAGGDTENEAGAITKMALLAVYSLKQAYTDPRVDIFCCRNCH